MRVLIIRLCLLFIFSLNLSANDICLSSNYTVLTPDSNAKIRNAAKELQKYLDKIFTKPLDIENNNNLTAVEFILIKKDSLYAKKLSFYKEIDSLKDDGFIIKYSNNKIFIVGSNDRAIFYGVYHFLEKYLGCKFLTKDFEYIPRLNKIILHNIYDKEIPSFIYREFFSDESDTLEFATKCRLNGRLGHRNYDEYKDNYFPSGKAIYNQFVSSELIDDDSYTCNGQYDFSIDKVSKIALKSTKEKLSKIDIKSNDYILLEHEDRDSYCSNGLSHNDTAGKYFLRYSSYIAQNLKDINVLYQAYQWSRKAPKNIKKLPENLTIFFSPIEADFSKKLNSNVNNEIYEDLIEWDKFGNDIFIWHYVTNFGAYFQPNPNIYALDKDIKLFLSLKHVKGIFLQSSYGTFGGELSDLRTWVFSKLLWNAKRDLNQLIKEFCDLYYGKASRDVQKYIRALHNIHKKVGDNLLVKSPINVNYLNPLFLRYLEEILDEGLKNLNEDNISKKHLLKLYSGIDYIRVVRGNNSIYLENSKSRFKKFLSNDKIKYFAEGADIDNIKKIIDIKRKIPFAPKEAKGLKKGIDWFEFQAYTLKLCCADLVEDIISSDGVSAIMRGEQDEWGFQLDINNFPKGKWNIYASVKIEEKDSVSLTDNTKPAIYYGIHPTFVKGVSFLGQFENNKYQTVKIGQIDTKNTNAEYIWLSPAANELIKSVYLDRIWVVRDSNQTKKQS
jgi:hypothetical protein